MTQPSHRGGRERALQIAARWRGVAEPDALRPRGALFAGSEPIAHRVDEVLTDGFGLADNFGTRSPTSVR